MIPARDRFWRRDAHIAIDEALRAGDLALHEAAVLRAVLAHSDDTGEVIWAGQAAIAQAAGWDSDRTARRWLRAPQNRPGAGEDNRPTPPMRTAIDATAIVLVELPEPPTTGVGAVLAERALRRARHGP